jgi:hypothetical protein
LGEKGGTRREEEEKAGAWLFNDAFSISDYIAGARDGIVTCVSD